MGGKKKFRKNYSRRPVMVAQAVDGNGMTATDRLLQGVLGMMSGGRGGIGTGTSASARVSYSPKAVALALRGAQEIPFYSCEEEIRKIELRKLERLDRIMKADLVIEAIEELTGKHMTARNRAFFGDLYADCEPFRLAVAKKFRADDKKKGNDDGR